MFQVLRQAFSLGASFMDLRLPEQSFAQVGDDDLAHLPVFASGTSDGMMLLVDERLGAVLFDLACDQMEHDPPALAAPGVGTTSSAVALWKVGLGRCVLAAADTPGCDRAQYALYSALGDAKPIAFYQSRHFNPFACTQPYLLRAIHQLAP